MPTCAYSHNGWCRCHALGKGRTWDHRRGATTLLHVRHGESYHNVFNHDECVDGTFYMHNCFFILWLVAIICPNPSASAWGPVVPLMGKFFQHPRGCFHDNDRCIFNEHGSEPHPSFPGITSGTRGHPCYCKCRICICWTCCFLHFLFGAERAQWLPQILGIFAAHGDDLLRDQ